MLEENKCAVCKAEFRKGSLVEGTCDQCKKLFPGISSKEELNKPKEDKENDGRMKNVIRKEVSVILEELGITEKCECGNSFYKRSPAQKICKECKIKNI